jgi:hypothetical protein
MAMAYHDYQRIRVAVGDGGRTRVAEIGTLRL